MATQGGGDGGGPLGGGGATAMGIGLMPTVTVGDAAVTFQ